MKILIAMLGITAAAILSAAHADNENFGGYLLRVDGRHIDEFRRPSQQAAGTPAEILARAQNCLARTVSPAPGESLIVGLDPANNLLVANSYADYTGFQFSGRAHARMTIHTGNGWFGISQTNIERAQNGAAYIEVEKGAGEGWNKALEALQAVSDGVAACVASAKS